MAFIPDQAIDELAKLSKGARHYYVFLARCRNQKTGKCCPSVSTTMEALGCNRGTVYALRKELDKAGWATFSGDGVTNLYGFESLKNQTANEDSKADSPKIAAAESEKSDSLKNQTLNVEPVKDSASLKNQTISPQSEKSDNASLKNQTNQSEKSDSPIRKNQQIEPAKVLGAAKNPPTQKPTVTSSARKSGKQPVNIDGITSEHPAISCIRSITGRYPDSALWKRIVEVLGNEFNQQRLSQCYAEWISHGWNKMNFTWLFEWYPKGMPQLVNGRQIEQERKLVF